jgi:predicted PurR-regulated permease PerM
MSSPTGTVERRLIRLTPAAALTIVGTIVGLIVARRVFIAAHRPLSWAAAAVVAAVMLDPVVDRLATHIRRVPAVLLTFAALGVVVVGTTYLVFDEIEEALARLETAAPDAAISIEERTDRVGELARDFELTDRITDGVGALQDRATGGEDVLRSTAGTAPTYLVCAILTVFLMTYGPRMARSALEQETDLVRRARLAAIVGPAVSSSRRAAIFAIAEALWVGLAAGGVAWLLDLPAPSAVGFAAGVLSLFPYVGLTLGAIPLLLLTLGFRSLPAALVLLVIVVVLQLADSMLVRPRMAAHSIHVGLVVPWVVALLGYSVYGIGGAAYAVAYALFGLAVLDRLDAANRARAGTPTAPTPSASPVTE